MQNVLLTAPYRFIPPKHGTAWTSIFKLILPFYLHRVWGIERVDIRGVELLKSSIDAGNGVLVAPNHCRPCDPMLISMLARAADAPFFIMASAHLFTVSRVQEWLLPRLGAFSIYREGLDRQALDVSMEILAETSRPLLIFAEGIVSRANDRLNVLQDGIGMIVKGALKRRMASGRPGGVAVHAVAIRYFFNGDTMKAVLPVLESIEARLTWLPRPELSVEDRVRRIGAALLTLKELEYLGAPQGGTLPERIERVIDAMLVPLESEWIKGAQKGGVIARVKRLRSAIFPDILKGELDEPEKERRWRQLAMCYYAQALSLYPSDYITPDSPPEHLLETVERFEEDLTDVARVHRPMRAVIEVCPALTLPASEEGMKRTGEIVPDLETKLSERIEALKACRSA